MAAKTTVVLVGTLLQGKLCVYSFLNPCSEVIQAVQKWESIDVSIYHSDRWAGVVEHLKTGWTDVEGVLKHHAREVGGIDLLRKHRTSGVTWLISDFEKDICLCTACAYTNHHAPDVVFVATTVNDNLCVYMFDHISDKTMEVAEILEDFPNHDSADDFRDLERAITREAKVQAWGNRALHLLQKFPTSRVIWFKK